MIGLDDLRRLIMLSKRGGGINEYFCVLFTLSFDYFQLKSEHSKIIFFLNLVYFQAKIINSYASKERERD